MHALCLKANLYDVAVCSKDVRLPQQMQRAMAAEAEATREAKAKVKIASCMSDGDIYIVGENYTSFNLYARSPTWLIDCIGLGAYVQHSKPVFYLPPMSLLLLYFNL